MNSSCSNAVRFDLGYNATNFAADTKFVEQVNCGAPSYRLLRGLTAGGSSLVGFPLIYKIKSKTYNSATSKYLYKFDVYKLHTRINELEKSKEDKINAIRIVDEERGN